MHSEKKNQGKEKGMKKNRTRILSLITAAAMLPLPAVPVTAQQAEPQSQSAKEYEIYPVPHSIEYVSENGQNVSFLPSASVNVVCESGIDADTKNWLDEVLADNALSATVSDALEEGKTNILVGVADSGGYVDSWYEGINLSEDLFAKNDAYAIEADENSGTSVIAILGKDTTAAYYGITTLSYMLSSLPDHELLEASIEDYSNGELRGFIEGFYGGFSYEGRESQIRFLRKVKGNMYVFASKTDPYHGGTTWQNLYPQEELDQISHLVQVARQNKVRYAWSFHSGKSSFLNNATSNPAQEGTAQYETYQQRLSALQAKFQQLYDIGVRDFHILNDDYNTGTWDDLAYFLNDMNAWIKAKGDCGPLVYCPVNYCSTWYIGTVEQETAAYKRLLDKDILLYWTGEKVNSPIVQQDIDFVWSRTGNEVVNWINFPCSEHDKAGIYLGAATHYLSNADGIQHSRGLMSNPVNYPEANKVAYFQLMSWLWNNDSYSTYQEQLWSDSFKYLEPEVADSYRTIAANVNNCPDSGRYPQGFPESEYIKDDLAAVQSKILSGEPIADDEQALSLRAEMNRIVEAVDTFRADCVNEALLSDLNPWLSSLRAIASAAGSCIDAAIALEEDDLSAAWTAFSSASAQLPLWNASSPREYPEKQAKAGSKRIQPFAQTLSESLGSRILAQINPDYAAPVSVITSFADNSTVKNMIDGDLSTCARWDIQQSAGDYYGLDLGKVIDVQDVSIVQAQSDGHHDRFHESTLEYSLDGQSWTEIESNINEEKIVRDHLNIKARYIRLRVTGFSDPNNPDKRDFWTRVREFAVNTSEDASVSLYTNKTGLSGPTASSTDTGWKLEGLEGVLLAPGEYIGLKLTDPAFLGTVEKTAPAGLEAQYSLDGVSWSSDPIEDRQAAVYVRLYNPADSAITLDAESLLRVTRGQGAAVSVTAANISSLREGAWNNLIDGDLNSYVWTGVNQAAGQSITVDFGRELPARSLSLFMDQARPRLYHGKVSTSVDGVHWSEAMVIDVNNDIALIDGLLRKARCELDVDSVRYVKIEVTDAANEATDGEAYLKLYELQLNDAPIPADKPSLITSTSQSPLLDKAVDGDLSTFFAPLETETSGSLEYTITDNNDASHLSVVCDEQGISGASVEILTDASDQWQNIGNLDEVINRLTVPSGQSVRKVRIRWNEEHPLPHIYEIFLTTPGDPVEEPVNLALRQAVSASACEDASRWQPEGAVDGDKTSADARWSAGRMKNGTAADQQQSPQWLMVDLGSNCEITSIVTSFYQKVYATDYDIQISTDGESWSDLATGCGFEASTTLLNPVDTLTLDTPAQARYVKFVYNAINHNAAGISVSVREVEIFGRRVVSLDRSLLQTALDKAQALDLDAFALDAGARAAFEQLTDQSEKQLTSAKTQTALDRQAGRLNKALLELRRTPDKDALSA